MTYRDLLEDALRELNIIDAEQAAQAADEQYLLRMLNRLQDSWNAHDLLCYVLAERSYTLTPGLNPHTLGASGTFITPRPEAIERAAIVVSSIVYPLVLRDLDWWARVPDPTLGGSIPTDLFYRPTHPNGSLYLWPVPSAAATLRIWTRIALDEVTDASTTFDLPPGYQNALLLTLAENAAQAFGAQLTPELRQRALEARVLLARKNHKPAETVQTARAGMPGWSGGGWDYRSGLIR